MGASIKSQDVLILLYLLTQNGEWTGVEVARALLISAPFLFQKEKKEEDLHVLVELLLS